MQVQAPIKNIAGVQSLFESRGDEKKKLISRNAIHSSVYYLRNNGFNAEEVQQCLVRNFYVDLDLLNEALAEDF